MKKNRFYVELYDDISPYMPFCFDFDDPYELQDKFLNMDVVDFKYKILNAYCWYINNHKINVDMFRLYNMYHKNYCKYINDATKINTFNWIIAVAGKYLN